VIRKVLWPAVMTLTMLLVLLALGTWQVHRLAWKEDLLAHIAHAEAAPPVPLKGVPSPFEKVKATGRLAHDKSALYGAEVRDEPTGPVLGAHLIEPLQRDDGETILVDRGWVPLNRGEPVALPADTVTVAGFIYPGDKPGWFSAHDDIVARHFYTLDPPAIASALGLTNVAPYILVAMGRPPPQGVPIPAQHLPRPPNNHLQYAATWYGLAGALVVVFSLWANKTVRA
jgi:surfeit locus 1 family protein